MKRYYARLDQEWRLFELEREPTMAEAFVRGWAYQAGAWNNRSALVWINPRYIRFHWSQDDQEEIVV